MSWLRNCAIGWIIGTGESEGGEARVVTRCEIRDTGCKRVQERTLSAKAKSRLLLTLMSDRWVLGAQIYKRLTKVHESGGHASRVVNDVSHYVDSVCYMICGANAHLAWSVRIVPIVSPRNTFADSFSKGQKLFFTNSGSAICWF